MMFGAFKMFSVVDFKQKDLKDFIERLNNQYSLNLTVDAILEKLNYHFFLSSNNKIYIVSKTYDEFEAGELRIEHIGSYFCEYRNGSIRLSFEGSQLFYELFKDNIKKNILFLDYETIKLWIKGNDLDLSSFDLDFAKFDSYVIVKNEDDIYGSGIIKDKTLLNFVSKNRRLKDVFE